ncbi:hypothetical protein Pst134EA_002777 [Puccinia striiformis f. sp. tritici]|uniref:Uncharacterized protein n=1 Tax=Puccinia striiformis f. sp. tritici PST-78 TaxID=1165861 RepID=A0A0L0VFR2_9BASI|nr:hypothetical protein Pst134EA_002777 [Puccinia striiformis f. sp. tritici]KAH9472152.1 hypothetical protein Pst134EA_002777 [Puccinia striiformis f. sp. tritici]KAI9628115.1 hypothetical protein KEM48_011793 [Puccinia striiformis f. sp. tritici PST-130]KNE97844.1 hypothetical protein PSTG_08867 [Puccinia striiformis f. sp. tritici PST-78]
MSIHHHLLDRRQQWETPMGGMASAIGSYAIHSRFLGVNPTVPHDLIASMLFCLVFAGLIGGIIFLGYSNTLLRTIQMYTLFAASLFLFLGFAIRAGISNSSIPKKSSFIVESLFFVFGQFCILDAWMMRMRDEMVDFLDHSHRLDLRGPDGWKSILKSVKANPETKCVLTTRILILPLCGILYIVGYASLPNPEDGLQTGRHGATREIASFLVFIAICAMQAISVKRACFNLVPWLPYTILFGISLLLWLPALYAFGLLAVALDTSSFVTSKTFFYVSFGFAQAVAIGGLVVMHRQKRIWEYKVGQESAPEGEGKGEGEEEDA